MSEKTSRVKLSVRKKLFFSTVMMVLALSATESAMRLCGYGPLRPDEPVAETPPEDPVPPDPFEYFTICDRQLGFRNRPNGAYYCWRIEGEPLVTTGEFGYRNGVGWTAEGTTAIVLFVGDSTTFCSEVGDDRTGPSEVARLLGEEFDVRVLNTGVRGYGTLQSKRMMQECLERFPDVKAVVYTHCGNDLEENLMPDMRFPVKVPVVERDARTGRFREVEVSNPAVPWGEKFYERDLPRSAANTMARATRWLDAHSAICHQCRIGWRRIAGRPPGDDPESLNTWAQENGGEEVLRWLVVEMDRICRSRGVVFVATSFYGGEDASTPKVFGEMCVAEGIRYVRLENHFTAKASSYLARRVDGRYDPHYGPLGTKTYAAAVAPMLRKVLRECLPEGSCTTVTQGLPELQASKAFHPGEGKKVLRPKPP